MVVHPDLPWAALLDFLLQLESAEDLESFYVQTMEGLTNLIPIGVSANCMGMMAGHLRCLASAGNTDEQRKFNGHYRQLIPFSPQCVISSAQTDYHAWEDTEYVTDFLRGCGVWRTLASPSTKFSVSLNRSRKEKPFSDKEVAIVLAISPHLETLYGRLRSREELNFVGVRDFELQSGDHLTRREVEILRLASFRQSNSDIAAALAISTRTVEKHLSNMYEKTGTSSRWELLWTYGAESADAGS